MLGVITLVDELLYTKDEFDSKLKLLLREVDWLERRMNAFRRAILDTSENRIYGPLTCIKIKELLEHYEVFALKFEEEYSPALHARQAALKKIEEIERVREKEEALARLAEQRTMTAVEVRRNEEMAKQAAARRAEEAIRLTEFAKLREKRQNEKRDFILERYQADSEAINEVGWRKALHETILVDANKIEEEASAAGGAIGPHWCSLELRKRLGCGVAFLRQLIGEPDAAHFRVLRCLNASFLEDFTCCLTNLRMLCAAGFKLEEKRNVISEVHDAQQSFMLVREDAPAYKSYKDSELFYVLLRKSDEISQVKTVVEFMTSIIARRSVADCDTADIL